MLLNESIIIENAKYVLSLSLSKFKTLLYDKNETNQNGDKYPIDVYHNQVRNYLIRCIENNGNVKSTYKQKSNQGRFYVSKFGIQSLQYKLRGFLIHKNVIDYDIKNCHLVLLENEFKKLNIDNYRYSTLTYYIQNRDKVLEDNGGKKFKKTILIAMNSDTFNSKNTFINKFIKELKPLKSLLLQQEHYKEIITTNINNPISSRVNKILCIRENEIIQKVINSYKLTNNTLIPMFDGLMTNYNIDVEDLNELTKEYNIEWTVKEPDASIVIPTTYIDKLNIDKEKQSNEIKKQELKLELLKNKKQSFLEDKIEFEKKNHIIKLPLTYRALINGTWGNYTLKDFRELYAHKQVEGEKCSFVDYWIKQPDKLQYDSIEFIPYSKKTPANINNNIFNSFLPFKYGNTDKIDRNKEDTILFSNYYHNYFLKIINVLCNNEKESYEYFLNWIAHIFQKPNELPRTNIFLTGSKGCGKSSISIILQKLLNDKYFYSTENPDELFGQFNSNRENKLLLVLEEMTNSNAVKYSKQILRSTTSNEVNIRRMRTDAVTKNNRARIIGDSNDEKPIVLTSDNRRTVLFKCTTELKTNTNFWNVLYNDILENEQFMYSLFQELTERDISKWNSTKIPITNAAKNVSNSNIPSLHRFLYTLKDKKYSSDVFIHSKKKDCIYYPRNKFREHYIRYCKNCGYSSEYHKICNITLKLIDLNILEKKPRIANVKSRPICYYIEVDKVINKLQETTFKFNNNNNDNDNNDDVAYSNCNITSNDTSNDDSSDDDNNI